jgi:lipase chaperone LimK
MRKAVTLGVAALLLGIIGLLLWLGHGNPETTATPAPASAIAPLQTASIQPAIPSAPAAEPANGFDVDTGGHLKITISARQLFDYFLGAGNTAAAGANTARAQDYIHRHLHDPAAAEALALLEHYVAYRNAISTWQKGNAATATGNTDMAAIATMQQLNTLKAQYLSPEIIQAFYGDEDAIARYQLARKQLQHMNGLSQEQKNEQLATLKQQLPLSAQKALGNAQDADE